MQAVFSGFDSAWTRSNRGAIAHACLRDDVITFVPPTVASFDDALAAIEAHKDGADLEVIGIDQPLIVPNPVGSRPVEGAFRPMLGRLKGAIQPANTGRKGMFDVDAPIWPFLRALQANDDPIAAFGAKTGRHAFEIYPAGALLGCFPEFLTRGRAPKYNPANKTFLIDDWQRVCHLVGEAGAGLGISGMQEWCDAHGALVRPRKSDQDCLDAAICVLITYLWWKFGFERSVMVGDRETGYIITPTCEGMSRLLRESRLKRTFDLQPE